MTGKLYLCATPIGNLGDITLRVLDVLRSVDLILAEDTRHTRKLLTHFDIHKPLLSYHQYNEAARTDEIIDRISQGENVALVSDAGMPCISDPGAKLAARVIEMELPWTVLPGPSACLTGLILSGLPADQFVFLGFPPRQRKARISWLQGISDLPFTLIFYEAPHRLADFLSDLHSVLGNRAAAVTRELTKRYEEIKRGNLAELALQYGQQSPRGEFVIVVEGAPLENGDHFVAWGEAIAAVESLVQKGLEPSRAIRQAANERGVSRRELYNRFHKID